METLELGATILAMDPFSLGMLITTAVGTAANIGTNIYQLATQEDPKEQELASGFKPMSGQGDSNLIQQAAQAELQKKRQRTGGVGNVGFVGSDLDPYLTQQAAMGMPAPRQ